MKGRKERRQDVSSNVEGNQRPNWELGYQKIP
jgi:hypothetical protein